jgi:hypothetical protein
VFGSTCLRRTCRETGSTGFVREQALKSLERVGAGAPREADVRCGRDVVEPKASALLVLLPLACQRRLIMLLHAGVYVQTRV